MNCVRCRQPVEDNRKFCGKCGAPTAIAGRAGDEPTFVAVRMNDVLENKWRLVRKLGEGGMGTVYLAHDLQLDRKVAIKILASSLAGDSELVTRFDREARMTASLEHPNIVPVYAVGKLENRPFIVMKKLEGRTLAAHLRECGAVSGDELLSLMRQLCSGLDFIHARGFIHRDIKSGNIFIGPGGHATILDFGILRTSENSEALTRTGMVMGTPQYMSPEQALGAREIDHRADLYALAVLLFECLTGTLPFEAESELSLIQMQAHAVPPDVIDRAPWVPKPVGEVVKRALAKRPEERYPSAGELLVALEDAYAGKFPAPVALSQSSAGVPIPISGSDPALGGPMMTQPSLKRLAVGAPGSRLAAAQAEGVPGAPNGSPRSSAIRSPAIADEPGARPIQLTERREPGTSELAHFARRGKAPAFIVVGGFLVLAVMGYVALGRPGASGSLQLRTSRAGQPASNSSPGALLDAGLDLREAFEDAVDGGRTVAMANVQGSASETADDRSDDSEDVTPGAALEDSRSRPSAKHSATRKIAATTPRGTGILNVMTTLRGEPYWAVVLVDGVGKGNTPLLLELPPGKHRVRLERAGFQPVNRQIKIASGRSRVLRVELTP